jgi:hypothetical protein
MHDTLQLIFRRLSIVVLVVVPSALAWLALSPQPELALARNLLLYRAEPLWRALAPSAAAGSGMLHGSARSVQGAPLAETTVVAAADDGRAFTALSDAAGRYALALPPGSYVPMATHSGFDDAPLRFGTFQRAVDIEPGSDAEADFVLSPALLHPFAADGALTFLDDTTSHTDIPQPADVRRRAFAFVHAGVTLTGSQVYEPAATGRYPVLLFIYPCWAYPCSVLGWDLLSASMAARGYVVVAYSPQRALDLEADMDDLLTLLAHIRANHLSALGDGSRVALLTGSLTSIHLWRVVQLAPAGVVGSVVVLGGLSDLFLIRERFEAGALALEPPFAEPLSTALIALGRPNLNPEFYVRYSPVYHLDALTQTPIALIYGGRDKIVPPEQTAHFSRLLLDRAIAHEVHLYPEQEHYLDLATLNPDELDMFEQVVGFLQRTLGK